LKLSHPLIIFVVGYLFLALLISFLPNSAGFIYVKLALIAVLSGGAWHFLKQLLAEEFSDDDQETSQSFSTSEQLSDSLDVQTERSIDENFQQYIDTLFPLVKQILVANTVVLLLVNGQKKMFFLRSKLSDFNKSFRDDRFFDLNIGLPSLVFKHRKTLLENHLPEGEQILPYYNEDMPAKSFLGVPLLFDGRPVGVFCVDSSVQACFSDEDQAILKLFSKLLALHLESSNKLFEYESENWTTRLLFDFSREILSFQNREDLWSYLGKSLQKALNSERVMISVADTLTSVQLVHVAGQSGAVPMNESFPLNEGLVGWVIRKNEALVVDDFSEKENYVPRFSLSEASEDLFHSLLAVPVAIKGSVKAVISVESTRRNHYDEQHKQLLETMANQVASWLQKNEILEQLNTQSQVDTGSGLLNRKAMLADVKREISRCNETSRHFCLQLISLPESLPEKTAELYPQLIDEMLDFAVSRVHPPATLYRAAENQLAVLWPEAGREDVKEKALLLHQSILDRRPWVNGLIEKAPVNSSLVDYPADSDNAADLFKLLIANVKQARSQGAEVIILGDDITGNRQ